MITQLLVWITALVLGILAVKIFKVSVETKHAPGKYLAGSLALMGAALVIYGVRDIFIQFGMMDLQLIFYKIGGSLQALAGFFMFIFVLLGFTSKRFYKAIMPIVVLTLLLIVSALIFLPLLTVEREPLFEIVPYTIIAHPWEFFPINIAFIVAVALLVALVVAIFAINSFRLKNPAATRKGFLYILGMALLFLSVIPSALFSPFIARLGYLFGAVIIYIAFTRKINGD